MPPEIAGAIATFITACATALLMYATSHWTRPPKNKDDEDDE